MHLLVNPGPRVYLVKWKYNEKKKRGKYKKTDITDRWLQKMFFCECRLSKKVTLADILKLLEPEIDFYDALFGCWAKELVIEGLSQEPPEKDNEIEYLELSWIAEYDKEYGIDGLLIPSFGGVGFDKTNYSISFSPVYELTKLPLKLGCFELTEGPIKERRLVHSKKAAFTLQQIIYGILYELSWFGGPKTRTKQLERLVAMKDAIKGTKDEKECG